MRVSELWKRLQSNESDASPSRRDLVEFEIGDRVRLSDVGRARCPSLHDLAGTVMGHSRMSCSVRVLFDGRRSREVLHMSYVELVPSRKRRE